jgi:hypothetical protein
MWTGTRKATGLALLLSLATLGLAACGSGSDATTITTTRPAVSRETADHLAKLSNTIASDLDAGETCSAAMAADDLRAAVAESDLPANIRPGVEDVATNLVNDVNCPPPPPPPEPAKEKKPKKNEGDEHGNGNGHGGDEKTPPGHTKHGGLLPPGHAKLKGEG